MDALTHIIGIDKMLGVVVIACVLVMIAMAIDLAAGLYKAKQRGEIRSSWGLKRTLSKFISYIGSLLIAAGLDILMHICSITEMLHLDKLNGIPVVTCVIAAFLLVVELVSIREKADEKTRTEMSRASELVGKVLNKDELVDALTTALTAALKKEDKQ